MSSISSQPQAMVFFGQYLLSHKVISQEALDQALEFQHEHNKLLGQLAVEKGYLTPDLCQKINSEQKSLDLPFGVIALRKGYLNEEELDDLLFSQVVNTAHVGEALVELGYIHPEDLGRYLKKYNLEEARRLRQIDVSLQGIEHSAFIRLGIHALDRAFVRFAGAPINIVSVGDDDIVDAHWSFLIELDTELGESLCMLVSLSDANAAKIAGKRFVRAGSGNCGLRCAGRVRMFLIIVKRYLCAHIKESGSSIVKSRMTGGIETMTVPDEHRKVILSSPAGKIKVLFFVH